MTRSFTYLFLFALVLMMSSLVTHANESFLIRKEVNQKDFPKSISTLTINLYESELADLPSATQSFVLGEWQIEEDDGYRTVTVNFDALRYGDNYEEIWVEMQADGSVLGERTLVKAVATGVTFSLGNSLNMDGNPITNVAEPTENQDTATKFYVDNIDEEITISLSTKADIVHQHDTLYYSQAHVDALEARLYALEQVLANFTRIGSNIYITGANLNIRSGSGSTHSLNGLGNLIIGYNANATTGGSHNMVIGDNHTYTSTGGFVAGYGNTINAKAASVGGGWDNTASGDYSSVSGGSNNEASGQSASVSGGYDNTASNGHASVNGGTENIASGDAANVSGGRGNEASGSSSSISGGMNNVASGTASSVFGGGGYPAYDGNIAFAQYSAILGGRNNITGDGVCEYNSDAGRTVCYGDTDHRVGINSVIVGGMVNLAKGFLATVSSGSSNIASGNFSSVSGGGNNDASGLYSSISGGAQNLASGYQSSISGGRSNTASGDYSSVSGGGSQYPDYGNVAYANYSSILGGIANTTGDTSSIDQSIGERSTISGGDTNVAKGVSSTVAGGVSNQATHIRSTVTGGNGLTTNGNNGYSDPGYETAP